MSEINKEEYRDIKGYEGYYQVSNLGNVRSVTREVRHPKGGISKVKGQQKTLSTNKKTGYSHVSLYKDCKQKTFLVHRLVAQAFPEICGEWFEGCEIDHIDTCRDNNNAYNLRICTRSENHLNPITRERYREKCGTYEKRCIPWNKGLTLPNQSGKNHFRAKAVIQYSLTNEYVNEFDTITEAAKETNIKRNCIDNCLRGSSKSAGGYRWKYKEVV